MKVLITVLSAIWLLTAQSQATPTTTTAATAPATMPVTTRPAVSNEIERILDRLEKKRTKIKDLEAKLVYADFNKVIVEKTIRDGMIRFKAATAKGQARFMVHFRTIRYEDEPKPKLRRKWYCFDGRRLRIVKERGKSVVDREVVKPGATIDPFALGGPFPVPFGHKKSEMLKHFQISLIPPTKQEKGKIDHLLLTPWPRTKLAKEYKRIEYWVDRKLDLPTKIVSEDHHKVEITATFSKIKLNKKLKDKDLWKQVPRGYTHEIIYPGK